MQIKSHRGAAESVQVETVVARTPPRRSAKRTPRVEENRVSTFEASQRDVRAGRPGAQRQRRDELVTSDLGGVRQGPTNACGPVALWLALSHFGRATPTWEQLDAELRPWSLGCSPGILLQAVRERGLQAQLYNRGTFEDLERETRQGRGVLAMTDVGGFDRPNGDLLPGDPSDAASHWVRVTRAWADANGRQWVEYENPWGTRETLRYEQFAALWRSQRLLGLPTGYDCAYILLDRAKARPLPPSTAGDVRAVSSVTDGAQDFVRGIDALLEGRALRATTRLVGGLACATLGFIGAVLAVPGEWLRLVGDEALDAARTSLQQGGLAAVGGVWKGAAGVLAVTGGTLAGALGNAIALGGQLMSSMLRGALGSIGPLWS